MNSKQRKSKKGESAASYIYRNSKNFVKERYGGKRGVSNLARDVAFLKAIVNVEEKRIDSLLNVTVGQNAPMTSAMDTIAQGAANNQRNGNSVKLTRIDLMMRFYYGSGTTSAQQTQTFRYFLIRYLKVATTSPTTPFSISEFLDADSSGFRTPISLPNTNYAQNFQILTEGTVPLHLNYSPATNSETSQVVVASVDVDIHQIYNGALANTLSDSLIVLVVVASQMGNTGGTTGVDYSVRQWFVDN